MAGLPLIACTKLPGPCTFGCLGSALLGWGHGLQNACGSAARPPKPWERQGGPTSSSLATNSSPEDVAKPWDRPAAETSAATITPISASTSTAVTNRARPWQLGSSAYGAQYSSPYSSTGYGSSYGSAFGAGYGGYGSSTYGSGAYGSNYGGYGSTYGNSMYGRPAGGYGGMYGQPYGGLGSPYGGSYGGSFGSLGLPSQGPYDPANPPPPPPSGWQAMLHAISGVVGFFGRLSFLVDENAHAVHFFVSALLQLLDRAGSLYGELARFVLRLLGYKSKQQAPAEHQPPKPQQTAAIGSSAAVQHHPPAPLPPAHISTTGFDSVWPS